MEEKSAVATSNALRAASLAVVKACAVASRSVHAMHDSVAPRRTATAIRIPLGSSWANDTAVSDREFAAIRAVLETRRAYLLALSLATQIHAQHVPAPLRRRVLYLVADTD